MGARPSRMLRTYIKRLLRNNSYFERLRSKRFFRQFHEISVQDAEAVSENLSNSWQDSSIPNQQLESVKGQLLDYRNGQAIVAFDSLVNILISNVPELNNTSILEIGCSSGYYSEVFQIKGIGSIYQGCDYSPEFIKYAQAIYPNSQWDIEDATALSYEDNAFDVVISGCCILHIFDFDAAISEAARVARKYVVFHRTPVFSNKETSFYLKCAYGVKMLEIHFSERELFSLMEAQGLRVIDEEIIESFNWGQENDTFSIKTYLCEKSRGSKVKTSNSHEFGGFK